MHYAGTLISMVDVFVLLAAVVVGIFSSGRLTRLITQDSFPPSVWLRTKWDDRTDGTQWNVLFHCHWCMSMWTTTFVGLWGWLSNLDTAWWVFNGLVGASYVVAMIVERDEVR